jgi:hypothetical protein
MDLLLYTITQHAMDAMLLLLTTQNVGGCVCLMVCSLVLLPVFNAGPSNLQSKVKLNCQNMYAFCSVI